MGCYPISNKSSWNSKENNLSFLRLNFYIFYPAIKYLISIFIILFFEYIIPLIFKI